MTQRIRTYFIMAIALLSVADAWGAPLQYGDILINNLFGPSILQFRTDGTFAASYPGSGINIGAGILPDGRLVTTFRGPFASGDYYQGGLVFFNQDGTTQSVLTPQVNLHGDVSVFSDGTLAVSSQWGSSIELYSPSGTHLKSVTHPVFAGDKSPAGTAVGPDDTLWTASARSPTINHFSKSGTFLGNFNASFDVGEVAVDPVDGTLWLPDENSNRVYNYSPTGTLLSSFTTAVPILSQGFQGIAVGPQRTIYVSSRDAGYIYRYNRNGLLLESFPFASNYQVYLNVVIPEPTTCVLAFSCVGLFAFTRTRFPGMHS